MVRAGTAMLVLAIGCVEAAEAQPVPRPNPAPTAAQRRRAAQVAAQRGVLLLLQMSSVADAGAATLDGVIGTTPSGAFGGGGLGLRRGGMALRADAGVAYGMGGIRRRGAPTDARFEEVAVTGPTARWQVLSELGHQEQRVHACLVAAGALGAVDLPLRFRVRGARVEDLSVEGATPTVERCVREHLSRALFAPSEAATEVSARLRVGPRTSGAPAPRTRAQTP